MVFVKGQIPWNKGIGPSKEVKEKIRRTLKIKYAKGLLKSGFQKGHPLYNNKLEKWRKNGGIPWNKNKTYSQKIRPTKERCLKIAERLKGNKNGKWNKGVKKNLTNQQRSLLRDRFYKNLTLARKRGTGIERKLQWILQKNGIEFRSQYLLLGKYIIDIFVEPNIVIEADGDYWHTLPYVQVKDKRRDKELSENGYKVIRFWGSEINNNITNCYSRLKQFLVLNSEVK